MGIIPCSRIICPHGIMYFPVRTSGDIPILVVRFFQMAPLIIRLKYTRADVHEFFFVY